MKEDRRIIEIESKSKGDREGRNRGHREQIEEKTKRKGSQCFSKA